MEPPLVGCYGRSCGVYLLLKTNIQMRQRGYMLLTLPEDFEARRSPQSTALHLAIGVCVSGESTLGQAAEVAGPSLADFLRELGQRRIPIHYGREELAADL